MAIQIEGLTLLIQVFDMPTSIRFYRDLLGFTVVNTSRPGEIFDWAMLCRGDTYLMLNTAYEEESRPAVPDAARVAAHADTILYLGCPDVDEAFRYLRDSGLAVKEPVVQRYGMKQVYLADPDGYGVCFQWRVQERGERDTG